MENDVNFDALARKTVESNGAVEALNNLWGAVFALAEWHFIARGKLPNVTPYGAANPNYADGKQMIRAFTDTTRLMRFAAENDLTKEDGSASILTTPTAGIIEYLEQFIPYGVHGVWFNSDTGSDGFFLPLAQLRPVKEHLAKINWQPPVSAGASAAAAEPALETILITVKDGLALPSGFVSEASYACNFFCRLPAGWLEGDKVKPELLEKIYEKVYGQNWRSGNSDGSRYVILDSHTKLFTPDEIGATRWSATQNTNDNHFWFYIAAETGDLTNVTPKEFQAHVEAAPPTAIKAAAPPLRSPAAEDSAPVAAALAVGGETGLQFSYFKKGEISFDASLVAFHEKIAPLLGNYQGTGDFGDILSLDAGAAEGLTETTASNAHGTYLRARRFFYQPAGDAMLAVQTLDSRALRQTETGAGLRINFALLKNLVAQTALLQVRFEGPEGEVLNLANAVTTLLENSGFKEMPGR